MAARILYIRGRRTWEPLAPAGLSRFDLAPGPAVDPQVVVGNPQVSLYCLDHRRRRAVFVETPAEVDVFAEPFLYQAQARWARRLIVLPYAELHRLAGAAGDPPARIIWIWSVGRCGSTLLSRMFGKAARCLSLSEPDVYTQAVVEGLPPGEAAPLLRSVTRLLGTPRSPSRPTHLAIKVRAVCFPLAGLLHEVFPEAKNVFLYRGAEGVVTSSQRAFRRFPSLFWLLDALSALPVARWGVYPALGFFAEPLRRVLPLDDPPSLWEMSRLGGVGMIGALWLAMMEQYLKFHRGGLPMIAVRYEDLAARPEPMLRALFAHCELPDEDVARAMLALGEDSQRGSILERRKKRRWRMTARSRAILERLLGRHPVIRSGDFLLPGTIG